MYEDRTTQIKLKPYDPAEILPDIPNVIFRIKTHGMFKFIFIGMHDFNRQCFMSNGVEYKETVDMWGIYDFSIMDQ